MGTNGILHVRIGRVWTSYLVFGDGSQVLTDLRKSFLDCTAIEFILTEIAKLVASGILVLTNPDPTDPPGPWSPKKCWPKIEVSFQVELYPVHPFQLSTGANTTESWKIHPVCHCLEHAFDPIAGQSDVVTKTNDLADTTTRTTTTKSTTDSKLATKWSQKRRIIKRKLINYRPFLTPDVRNGTMLTKLAKAVHTVHIKLLKDAQAFQTTANAYSAALRDEPTDGKLKPKLLALKRAIEDLPNREDPLRALKPLIDLAENFKSFVDVSLLAKMQIEDAFEEAIEAAEAAAAEVPKAAL